MYVGEYKKPKKYNKIPTPFSKVQLQKLFEYLENGKISMICFVSLITGMRLSEVLTLKLNDIEWELKRIVKQKTKGGKPRVYYLSDNSIEILKKWICLLNETEYVFPSQNNNLNHMNPKGFYGEFRKYLKKSNLWIPDYTCVDNKQKHKFTFHTFRTTFCSLLINSRVDIYTTKELMGHSKISTTERYYIYLGDLKLKEGIQQVFGRKQTEQPKKALSPSQEYSTQDPMQLLKLQLVNNQISLEDYEKKAEILVKFSR